MAALRGIKMEWEINWLRANAHMYEGPMHVQAVIQNIIKRYEIRALTAKLKELEE